MENHSEPSNHSNKSLRRNSKSHLSISDTDSAVSPTTDCWHSPLRSESPLRSDDPCFYPENDKNGRALAPTDKSFSPLPSPAKSGISESHPFSILKGLRPWPQSEKPTSRKEAAVGGTTENQVDLENHKVNQPVIFGVSKSIREEPAQIVKKLEPVGGGAGVLQERHGGGRDAEVGGVNMIPRRSERRRLSTAAASLTFRIIATIICLVSFSVMAADKTRGWSGDSFDRYIEYRFCLAVNVIGFVYSGFQALDLVSRFHTEKHTSHRSRYCFDFSMDQILAYLLVSASSSAATRVNDWILNWGRDEFTTMASSSIALSFLAFFVLALSSLVSGYNLCNSDF